MRKTTHDDSNRNAVIYCRVSTGRQVEEGGSLSSQERICRDYAIKNNYTVLESFIEKGESAKTADRTVLTQLRTFCADRKNKVGTVIFYKVDRFSRYTEDYSEIRKNLRKDGIQVRSASETFDDTPTGKLMENVLITMAQFDNDVRAERCAGGMRDAMREGRYVWCAPFGFDNIRINGRATIAQNEKAFLVRKAFFEIAKNMAPAEEIRKRITKEGLQNKRGTFISKSQFYRMLKNETYAGWIIKFGERHKGLFDPIVPQEIFDQVQCVLGVRGHKNLHYLTENPSFPLRRFLYHPSGRKLTGCWSKGRTQLYPYYRYYIPGGNYKKEIIENKFMTHMAKYALEKKHFEALVKGVKEHLDGTGIEQQKERVRLTKQASELKEKQTALIQKNLSGVISDAVLQQQLQIIDTEMLNVNAILSGIPEQKTNYSEVKPIVEEFIKNPGKIWAKAPFHSQLRLQWFVFPKGIVFDGENCRTTELCRIFNDKTAILGSLAHSVDFMHSTTNQVEEIQWSQIGHELEHLAEILHEAEKAGVRLLF